MFNSPGHTQGSHTIRRSANRDSNSSKGPTQDYSNYFYPLLIVISSPSGGGKSTICRMLLSDKRSPIFSRGRFSISATTRTIRGDEANGKQYYFLEREEFDRRTQNGEFLEFCKVFENLYGTLVSEISDSKHTLFDIDHQGQKKIKEKWESVRTSNHTNGPEVDILQKVGYVSIFLLPPSVDHLRKRLGKRNDISPEEIEKRIKVMPSEVEGSQNYDYIILNNDLERAFLDVCSAIRATILQSIKQKLNFESHLDTIIHLRNAYEIPE